VMVCGCITLTKDARRIIGTNAEYSFETFLGGHDRERF
jgi:hypothetical protein